MNKDNLKNQIFQLINEYYTIENEEFIPGKSKVALMYPTYGAEEVKSLLESLLSTQITLNQSEGNKVARFEKAWADYVGMKHCIMVNSGSSANLLNLFFLASPQSPNRILPGDEIITPAVTWTTTVSPIWSIGAIPVFVDIDKNTMCIDADEIEKAISPKTKAIMPVHLLGQPCNMNKIMEIAKKHNLTVIEDCCEAHGAQHNGQKVGSFADFSTFSFFFAHHLTTMEGGAILTNNDEYAEDIRNMRSQGVVRNVIDKEAYLKKIYKRNEQYRNLDISYMFTNMGFNLRPTELNGSFGLVQLQKLEEAIRIRRKNVHNLNSRLRKYSDFLTFSFEQANSRHVYYGIPLIVKEKSLFTRNELVTYLRSRNIETRPIMTGLITNHPVMEDYPYNQSGALTNAKYIDEHGFFIGNNPKINIKHINYVADCIDEFIAMKS